LEPLESLESLKSGNPSSHPLTGRHQTVTCGPGFARLVHEKQAFCLFRRTAGCKPQWGLRNGQTHLSTRTKVLIQDRFEKQGRVNIVMTCLAADPEMWEVTRRQGRCRLHMSHLRCRSRCQVQARTV